MTFYYHQTFRDQFKKLSHSQQKEVRYAISLFEEQPDHPTLRIHTLREKWQGYRTLSANPDLRVHFRILGPEQVLFVAVGTHSQLYK